MLLRLKEFIFRVYPRDKMMDDTLWMMFVFSAVCFQIGLWKELMFAKDSLYFLAAGGLFVLFGGLPLFWPRIFVLVLTTAALIFDFVMRRNPFSVLLIWVCFGQTLHLSRSVKTPKEENEENPAEA